MDQDPAGRLMQRAHKGIARLLLKFNINFESFSKQLRDEYVHQAHLQCGTITRTALKTGIDRRTVSAIVKDQSIYQKPSSVFAILGEIGNACQRNGTRRLPKIGEESLESIIKSVAHGSVTLNSVISELAELGCIRDSGDHIEFITAEIKTRASVEQSMQISANHMDRYADTVVKNIDIDERELRLFEYSVFSTQIPPQNAEELHHKVRVLLLKTVQDLRQLHSEAEQAVSVGSHPEIGVSLTEFNFNEKKKRNDQ